MNDTAWAAPPAFDSGFAEALDTLFRWRRDVRHFRREPLPPGMLDTLFAHAELAPSVGLSEPWRFVTVDDPARRAAIRASFEQCNREALAAQTGDRAALYARLKLAALDDAPCQFALFAQGDPPQGHGLGRRTMPETIAYSAVLALHTLWLSAVARGLGLGWVSIIDPAQVARILDVPADWRFIGYFCLGYPQFASDTPELARVGWEQRAATVVLRR